MYVHISIDATDRTIVLAVSIRALHMSCPMIIMNTESKKRISLGGAIMKRELTPEQLAKKTAKEAKELARLQKEKAKSKPAGYVAYLLIICTFVFLADELCSNLEGNMKSILSTIFYQPIFGAEDAVAKMNLFAFIPYYFFMFAFLYKPLADRFGRKPFIVINTIGMGLGMVIIGLATNIPVYLIGSIFITFFTPHDMQSVYILESSPKERRATFYSVSKAIAAIGVMILPLLRNAFVRGTDPSAWQWRYVYLIPSLLAFVIAIVALFFLRETDSYIDMRIKQLTMTPEEKEEAERNKAAMKNSRGGLLSGIKYIFKNKQLKWLALTLGIITIGGNIGTNYEPMLTFGYARHLLDAGSTLELAKSTATTEFVNRALILFPLGSALIQFVSGFISDKIGRKKTAIVVLVTSIAAFLIAYFGARNVWNVYLVGILTGVVAGGTVAANDCVNLMVAESTPTNLRASTSAAFPIISGMLSLIGIFACTILQNIFGDIHIGLILLLMAVPPFTIGLILLMFKTKETKNVDLEQV